MATNAAVEQGQRRGMLYRLRTRGDATLYFGRDQHFKTADITVVAEHVDLEQFRQAVHARATEIAQRTNYETNGSMLVEQQWTSTVVLLRYYSSPDVADSHSHELHALVPGARRRLKLSGIER